MGKDVGGLRELLLRTIGNAFMDVIPYDMTNDQDQINRWAIQHDIRRFAVWISVHLGFRQLPEPYFSQDLCRKIKRVLTLYNISRNTRYVDLDPAVGHVLKWYRDMERMSDAMIRDLMHAIPHDDIILGMQKYAEITSFQKCKEENGLMWKLVNTREQLRSYVHVCLGGEDWPVAPTSWDLFPNGIGQMVKSYTRQTDMQQFISERDGRFLGCPVGGVTPIAMYELATSFGMGQLPEPYASMHAMEGVTPDPTSSLICAARLTRDFACTLSLAIHHKLWAQNEYNNASILNCYLDLHTYMRELNAYVAEVRQRFQHTCGCALPLTF